MTDDSDRDDGSDGRSDDDDGGGGYLASARLVAVLTLVSRILGLVRDMGMAKLFGATRVMDAFVLAFTAPNLFRKLFGEGALSSAFVPLFARTLADEGRERARRVLSVVTSWTALGLSLLAVLGVCGCLAWRRWGAGDEHDALVLLLVAILLPYLVFICLVALMSGALNTLRHFLAPALAPILFNCCWLAGIYLVVDWDGDQTRAAVVLAVCLAIAGFLQLLLQVGPLKRLGMLPRPAFDARDPALPELGVVLAPMIFGAAIFQLNVLADRLIAWWMIPPASAGGQDGALTVLYLGNRLMQFPLGIIGVAMATAAFPLLARLAAQVTADPAARARFREVVVESTAVTLLLAVPASVGLLVVRDPMIELFFVGGNFSAADGLRTGVVLAVYSGAIWAACLTGLATRALYSVGEVNAPVRIGALMVALNLALNLALVGPLAEVGLAIATVASHLLNVALLYRALAARMPSEDGLPWLSMAGEAFRIGLASALMGLVAWYAMDALAGRAAIWRLAVPTAVGLVVYAALAFVVLPVRAKALLRR